MSARLPVHSLYEVAQKWRALAERRCAHFVELYHSGRWRHYYSEERFLLYRMREAIRLSERWAKIAPPPEGAPAEAAPSAEPLDRTAA
jgi:uncharacterized repeat protein (TIGR03809 family)